MNLKHYPEYKDSGVEWIGEIPKEWNCSKIKHITDVKISNVDKKSKPSEADVLLCNYTDVYNNEFIIQNLDFMKATASFEQINKLSLHKGDVIITKDSETADDIAVPALVTEDLDNVVCGYHLALIRPNDEMQGDYLFRLLESKQINDQFVISANGVTRFGISTYPIKNSYLMVPSLEEQEKISTFLDKKTSEIDLTIEKETRLIELLKEKRTALINHVVTKGLDPTVKMKDSGVEWIGEIPEDWEISKIKHVSLRILTGKTPPSEREEYYDKEELNWFTPGDLGNNLVLTNSSKRISKSAIIDNKVVKYKPFSILLVGIGATLGKVGLSIDEGTSNQQINAIEFYQDKIMSKYGLYYLYGMKNLIISLSNSSTIGIFNQTQTGNFIILKPPINEQKRIIGKLDEETMKIDFTIKKIQQKIKLLEEYKKSLIHHVVTGKVDVREVAV
ncbi:hypothetical protein BK009_07905 [Methanobacterium subterraneum]|uniref:Type I restriction modification DNA specificity domain-containing protein n=1 Tax=Methanobacterium subterraneum TaxID=59277 RepID=A0A2H4VR77_9EURY|nr:restriction endonuclease subunit S [Methanobacterium subterraneum]AUB60604.1 hypothetical protein BK009_07905 [Methanobacterium subterraneum]